MVNLIAGGCLGFGLGLVVWYFSAVRPMVKDFTRLRYDGFRPEYPMPERPKTVPLPREPD